MLNIKLYLFRASLLYLVVFYIIAHITYPIQLAPLFYIIYHMLFYTEDLHDTKNKRLDKTVHIYDKIDIKDN